MEAGSFTMPDGRQVGVAEYGARDGVPVIWCHGGPGSRLEPAYVDSAAAAAGLRIVGIDRPGYGRSTPLPGRTIGGWANDALAVADALGIGSFATLGVSTGGAHALAVAAGSPRVTGVVACCAVTDMRWAEGRAMMTAQQQIWSAPDREAAIGIYVAQLGKDGTAIRADSELMPLAASDAQLFADPAWARNWELWVSEWFAQGVVGYVDDRLADGVGWVSFDVGRIACPAVVLHGTHDTMVPVAQAFHTRDLVPHAALELRDGLGHFSILTEVVPALQRLLRS
jgi:pimeloyl-ACP methyl ester carboxylesterase